MSDTTRRTFTKTAVAATALSYSRILGANDRVRMGYIGLGNRGDQVHEGFLEHGDQQTVAICDLKPEYLDLAAGKSRSTPRRYQDYRALLEDQNVDAVVIATPDHWHALMFVDACHAGKDVYVEKPLSLTVAEGRRMVEVARRYNRVMQVGSQQRSAPHFAKCAELVQSGYVGDVSTIDCWIVSNEAPAGFGPAPDGAPPEGLDWDLYLGPSPKVPYNRNRYIWNWRWWWDYAGGNMTDWGAHHIDSIHQIMNADAPVSVFAAGSRMLKDNRDAPDTFLATIEYPKFSVRFVNSQVGYRMDRYAGTLIYGTKGTLFVDRKGYEVMPSRFSAIVRGDLDQVQDMLASRRREVTGEPRPRGGGQPPKPYCDPLKVTGLSLDPEVQILHVENFLDCVKSRQRPVADVEIGHRSIVPCHLANVSYRVGRKLRWDGLKEKVLGDAEASTLLGKRYRAPWSLPKV